MQQLPILLLEHVGRRSGERRTTPLLYLQHGEDLVIVASRGGSDAPPAWWLNLQANPHVTVEIRGRRTAVIASETTAEERQHLWPELVRGYSHDALYAQRTSRDLPVIILTPEDTEDGLTRSGSTT
jgi:deazaflavin-dependent oxidoreductase (nitroreductase family)